MFPRRPTVHESGLGEAIVDAALRRSDGRTLTGVRVRVGGHPVDADVVRMSFALAAMGTPAEAATVELVLEPMTVECNGCGRKGPVADHLDMVACPACGAVDIELEGHDELILEAITVAVPPPEPVAGELSEGG